MKKINFFSKILTGIITVAIVAVVAFLALNNRKTKLYSDSSTTGNTACNLLNGGLFTQADNVIYFANPNDNNKLYKMNANLTKIQKLYNDKVSYINAAGNYIFYTRRNDKLKSTGNALLSLSTTGLFRITKNGTDLGRLYAVERFKSLFYVHLAMIAHHTVDLNGLFHLFCLLFTCRF